MPSELRELLNAKDFTRHEIYDFFTVSVGPCQNHFSNEKAPRSSATFFTTISHSFYVFIQFFAA